MTYNLSNWIENVDIPQGDTRPAWSVYYNSQDKHHYAVRLSPYPIREDLHESDLHTVYADRFGHLALWEIMDKFFPDKNYDDDEMFAQGNLVQWGDVDVAEKMSYEWFRPLVPNSNYLFCLRVSPHFMRNVMFAPESNTGEAPPREDPVQDAANRRQTRRQELDNQTEQAVNQVKKTQRGESEALSRVKVVIKLDELSSKIKDMTPVLRSYSKAIRKSQLKPEDIGGLDLAKEVLRLKTTEKQIQKLLVSNNILFDKNAWKPSDIIEMTFDTNYELIHFTFNDGSGQTGVEPPTDLPAGSAEPGDESLPVSQNPSAPGRTERVDAIYYNGFGRRDIPGATAPVFIPKDFSEEEEKAYLRPPGDDNRLLRRVRKATVLRRKRDVFKRWNSRTFSLLANINKITKQKSSLPDSLEPWTEFLPKCVYPNPCAFPEKIEAKKHTATQATPTTGNPNELVAYNIDGSIRSLDAKAVKTTNETNKQRKATPDPMREKLAAARAKATNIVADPILGCDNDISELIRDLSDLYSMVLDRVPFSELMAQAANDIKKDMKSQVASAGENLTNGVTAELDRILKEVECATDIISGELESKVLSAIPGYIKDVPGVDELLSQFDLNPMQFDFSSIDITSMLSFIQDAIEKIIIETIEEILTTLVTDAIKSLCDAAQSVDLDGLKDNFPLDSPLLKVAFGAVPLSSLVDEEAIKDLAEQAGIDPDKIQDINDRISSLTNPEELKSLLYGEASLALTDRLFDLVDGVTSTDLASYLDAVGRRIPKSTMDNAFIPPAPFMCLDDEYLEAAGIIKDLLGAGAVAQAKSGLERNKDRLKSICAAMSGQAIKDAQDKINNLPAPKSVMDEIAAIKRSADASMIGLLDGPLGAFTNPFEQSWGSAPDWNGNLRLYTNESEYPSIKGDTENLSRYRLGKMALSVYVGEEDVTYRISLRAGPTRPARIEFHRSMSWSQKIHQEPSRTATPADIIQINRDFKAHLDSYDAVTASTIKWLMWTAYSKEEYRGDRETHSSSIRETLGDILGAIGKEGQTPLRDMGKDTDAMFHKALFMSLYGHILPFLTSLFYSTMWRRTALLNIPSWGKNDEVVNRLVTNYLYTLLMGLPGQPAVWQNVIDFAEQYGGTLKQNYTRTATFGESLADPTLRNDLLNNAEFIYFKMKQDKEIIKSFANKDESTDEWSKKDFLKGILSTTLNMVVGAKNRSTTLETMMSEKVDGSLGVLDFQTQIPAEALVALYIIQTFHDSNGWRQVTYIPSAAGEVAGRNPVVDINYRNFRRSTEKLLIESRADQEEDE